MLNRRGFVQRTLGALAAIIAAPFAPAIIPALPIPALPKQALAFHPDAFALAMDPITRFDVL